LRVSERVVRYWITDLLLPAYRSGRKYRVNLEDLETALRRGDVAEGDE
jgi:excisionase family DNA binding protein